MSIPLISCSAALLAALLIPSVARAEDEPPFEPPSWAPAAPDAPGEAPDAPGAVPAAPEAGPDPCAPAADSPCHPAKAAPCAEVSARWGKRRGGRLAIGLGHGRVEMDDDTEGTQRSLIARLSGRRGWAVELELSKLALGGDDGRLVGGAIVKAFGRRKLAPYVIAGAGRGELARADGSEQHLRFAEAGGGLMLRKRRLSIGIDLRRGARRIDGDAAVMEPTGRRGVVSGDDHERYTRGRVIALFHF